MHHLYSLISNPIFWVGLLILLNYHHFPKKFWKPFEILFKWLWFPVVKLDEYLFKTSEDVKEIKKSKFKKIVSPFGKLILLTIAFVVYLGDELFFAPASRLVDKALKSKEMEKAIKWVEKQDILVLRLFVGLPFIAIELTGIFAGILLFTFPFLAVPLYITKIFWVVVLKFIDKIAHDKLSQDPWYSGLKALILKVLDAGKKLYVMKSLHNKIVALKNFMKDSNHNTMLEIKIRKKLIVKTFKEIWSLNHLTDELSDSSDVGIVFFGAEATKKLNLLKENPDNQLLRDEVMDYVLSEASKKDEKMHEGVKDAN